MNPDSDRNYIRVHRGILLAAILILGAGILGWLLGRSDNKSDANTSQTTITETARKEASAGEVDALVTYKLPDGWSKAVCEGSEAAYITPAGEKADCGSDPAAPIKLSVDPGDTKDCNELQNVSDVKKHVCISLYINGKRSLKSSTEYLASSAYNQETTIDSYYIDTGKGVVRAEYRHGSSSELRVGFDQLVDSISTK